MTWLLPRTFGRPRNLLCEPVVTDELPARQAGWWGQKPDQLVPGTVALLQSAEAGLREWQDGCDFLLAAWPQAGAEHADLLALLDGLPSTTPVVLFEHQVTVLPNLVVASPDCDPAGADNAAAGLRVLRSALRHQGCGQAEALVLLPAGRMRLILRGSSMAVKQPDAAGSLQNRRYLHHLLDHARSLSLLQSLLPLPSNRTEHGDQTAARRSLFLAPHFDDECLLFASALHQAQQRGDQIRLLWMTDGGENGDIRSREGAAACRALGIEPGECLGAPESNLRARGKALRGLRHHLAEFQPQVIHLPWWLDNHIDHYEVSRLLAAALPDNSGDLQLGLSGLWTPLPRGMAAADGGEPHPSQLEAIACHTSQLAELDYVAVSCGLIKWQENESLWCLSARDYFGAFKRSGSHRRWYR
jgi:LmbE family N-acetylglucosaminyl deacetylase